MKKAVVTIMAMVCGAGQITAATILTRDKSLDAIVPKQAYNGVGAWTTSDYYVATGHASAESLGGAKGKRTAQELAEVEAKALIAKQAALEKEPSFDVDAFELDTTIAGFRIAATYKLRGKEGVFLIGLAPKKDVHVRIVFVPQKARQKAFQLFEAGRFREAAAQFALLTQRGIQDGETIALARAAGWHVNLLAGVGGEGRAEALRGLGEFYYARKDYEASLQHYYALYKDSDNPDRELLGRLIELSHKTNREKAANGFRKELNERFASKQ